MKRVDDDFLRPKMGRYDEAEERRWEKLLSKARRKGDFTPLQTKMGQRRKTIAPLLSDRALRTRIQVATNRYDTAGREVIVKATNGPPKTIASIRNLVRYISRPDAAGISDAWREPVQLFNGYGAEIPVDSVDGELDAWNLQPNRENLSKAARSLWRDGNIGAFRELRHRERYRNVQAWHFVWSIQCYQSQNETYLSFKSAVSAAIGTMFTDKGHQCLWAIHLDKKDRIHAHIVVEALSSYGRRIRCDLHGDYLYSMRVEFARELRISSLGFIATRREDDNFLRRHILVGDEPLRNEGSLAQVNVGGGDLTKRAPHWWREFGADVVENWEQPRNSGPVFFKALKSSKLAQRIMQRRIKLDKDALPMRHHALYEIFLEGYENPIDAVSSWVCLAQEGGKRDESGNTIHPNRNLAIWYLLNKPETFGRLIKGQGWPRAEKALKRFLREVSLPIVHEEQTQGSQLRELAPEPPDERQLMRIRRDRLRLSSSVHRLSRIAEVRGYPKDVVDDIKLRLRDDMKEFQIGGDAMKRIVLRPAPVNRLPLPQAGIRKDNDMDLGLGVTKPARDQLDVKRTQRPKIRSRGGRSI